MSKAEARESALRSGSRRQTTRSAGWWNENEEPGVGDFLPSSVLQVAAVTIITVRHSHPGRGLNI